MRGDIEALVLPATLQPERANNLWKTTCFEVFLMPSRSSSYLELNFSPSGRWAAYDFAAYRKLVSDAWLPAAPDIEISKGSDQVELTATMSLDLPNDPYRLGISAIIEEVGGGISYWAVNHAPDKPDFHHPDCFALELPAG